MDKRLVWTVLFIGLFFTVCVMQWSFRLGRLSMDPVYDDVEYLLDARQRLDRFDQKGIVGLAWSLWRDPPHSPWSTLAAFSGFVVFGVHPWAPYAINVVLVIAFILAADYFFGVKSFWAGVTMSLAMLALPMTLRAVHDFRPDFAVALATAFACLTTIRLGLPGPHRQGVWQRYLGAGMLFGSAYLIKPSFVYHTTAMLLVSLLLSEVVRLLFTSERGGVWFRLYAGLPSRTGSFLAGCFVISGMYYLRAWKGVVTYVATNTGSGSDANLWRTTGGVWGTFKEYVFSGSMAQMLGPFLWLLLAVTAAGLVFNLMRKEWKNVAVLSAGLLCSAASLGVMCIAEHRNEFFGLTWQMLLAFSAISALGTLSPSSLLRSGVVFFALATGLIKAFGPHGPTFWQPQTDALVSRSLNKALIKRFEQLGPVIPDSLSRNLPIIYVAFAGAVESETQRWLAEDEKYRAQFFNLHRSGNLEEHRQMIAAANIVEIASANAAWLYTFLPSAALQKDLLAMMRNDPLFVELAPVRGTDGKVYLFARKATFQFEERAARAVD